MTLRLMASAFSGTILVGCGLSHDMVRTIPEPAQAPIVENHPLTDRVFGAKSIAFAIRCTTTNKPITTDSPTNADTAHPGCPPLLVDPYYSLSLSGGGYRATLFHYGALKRLNDVGQLQNVRMVCGVSGGAITGALLVHRWKKLKFDENGVATNLHELVGQPLYELTSRTLDRKITIKNLLPTGSNSIASALDDVIFHGDRLSDLPGDADSPLLSIGTVNYETGRAWGFSRNYFGGGMIEARRNDFRISQAVAASGAFPPVLGPIGFKFEAAPFPSIDINSIDGETSVKMVATALLQSAREEIEYIGDEVLLVDGGVLDNNALRHCAMARRHLISSAARADAWTQDASSWAAVVARVVDLIHGDGTDARFTRACARDGSICWELRNNYRIGSKFGLDDKTINALSSAVEQPTRFKQMDEKVRCALVTAGYLATAGALLDKSVPGTTSPAMLNC